MTTTVLRRASTRTWRLDPQFMFAATVLAAFVVLSVAGAVMGGAATATDIGNALQAPSAAHWFGTDSQGRDVFARVAVGARIAMISATIVVTVSAALGLVVALLCGLGPRWVDAVLIRVSDAILAFPQLLLALAVALALGAGLETAVIGIIVTIFPVFTRTLRGEALRSRREPFVEAARTIGLSTPWIAVRHVVPYLSTTLVVQAASNFGQVILLLAGLSFIGVGAKPPTPEWGAMITDSLESALVGQWWVGFFPGVALLLVVVAVNIFADRLPKVLASRRKGLS